MPGPGRRGVSRSVVWRSPALEAVLSVLAIVFMVVGFGCVMFAPGWSFLGVSGIFLAVLGFVAISCLPDADKKGSTDS